MSTTPTICSSDGAAMAFFRAMLLQPREKGEIPSIAMTDETARDIQLIWASIEGFKDSWPGSRNIFFPGKPVDRKEFWGAFAKDHKSALLPIVGEFVGESSGEGKTAIDLGCGDSPVTPLLLQKGWRVIAVDNSRSSLEMLASQNSEAVVSRKLMIVEEDVAVFTPSEPADLVVAADILPYTNPAQFRATWAKIHDTCVKPGGFFGGSLFRSSDNLFLMNMMKEMGAWFLWDRRMVRPLLTSVGYDIKVCKYRIDDPQEEPVCIQFIAQKI